MREKFLRRNIKIAYLINFLRSFLFYAPILALYLQEQLFSVLNVTIILSIIIFGSAVLEIPTGAFADIFGRKKAIVLASLVSIIAVVLLAIGSAFLHFVVYAVIAALSLALMSGTDESLLFDSLVELKKENTFKKVIGIQHAVSPVGHSVASIIGGILAINSLRTPVAWSIIPFIVAFFASLFLIEPEYHKSITKNLLSHTKDSMRMLFANRQLLLLTIAFLLFEAFGESIHQISQLFYAFNQIPVGYFGFIFAGVFALSALGSFISHEVSGKFGNKNTLITTAVLSMLVIFAATYTSGWVAVLFLVSGSIFFGIRNPVMSYMTNLEITSTNRATILSIKNLATSAGFAVFAPILGFLTDSADILNAYRIFASFYILLILTQGLLKERN